MKRYFAVMLALCVLFVGVGEAKSSKKKGRLSVSAGVSVYNPPGTSSSSLLFEIAAKYRVSDKFTADMSVGWTQYDDVTLMPIKLNGEFHPLGDKVFDPYVGAGSGLYLSKVLETTSATVGVQAFAGLKYSPSNGIGFSGQVEYMLTDISDANSGGLSFGGNVEGNWEVDM